MNYKETTSWMFSKLPMYQSHGKSAYKTLLIWPYAIAPAVVGVMANYFFSERFGLLYHLFNDMWGFNWYESVYDAYIYVIVAGSWKQISANFIFFLAGLQAIQVSVIEASMIDCKSSFRRFWTITFPLLMPTTFFLIIINITYAFFDTFGTLKIQNISCTERGNFKMDSLKKCFLRQFCEQFAFLKSYKERKENIFFRMI